VADQIINVFVGDRDQLDRIEAKLDTLIGDVGTLEDNVALDFNNLNAQVTAINDAAASAETLLTQLADELSSSAGDQAAVDSVAQQLRDQASALAASVVANTPAAPAPPPTDSALPPDAPPPDAPPADAPPVDAPPQ
jgi:hypothetical protein